MAALWRARVRRLGGARLPLGARRLPGARHRHPDGRLLGLQDARLGRLLGLGPGRERLVHPLAVRHRADPRPPHGAHHAAATAAPTTCSPPSPTSSVLYGTFLTRSGVLADFSVHSFVDLGISGWLIGILALFMLLRPTCWRRACARCRPSRNEDPVLSRGTFMVLATITLLGRGAGDHRRHLGAAAHPLHGQPGPGRARASTTR